MEYYRKAHYDLNEIKRLLQKAETRIITKRSKMDAFQLGYVSVEEMVERVQKLVPTEIDKTMTSNADSTLWQDVYKTYDDDNLLYIKLQISHNHEGVIVSFHVA